jgi:hypothetical protein
MIKDVRLEVCPEYADSFRVSHRPDVGIKKTNAKTDSVRHQKTKKNYQFRAKFKSLDERGRLIGSR